MSKTKFLAVAGAVGAFFAMGPLQQAGVLPQTVIGEASKVALSVVVRDAQACPPGGGGGGNGKGGGRGNNGFGNGGGDGVPGRSGFQDRTR